MKDEEKKELFQGLRKHYGAQTEIARRTSFSLKYVREVLGGVRNNDSILTTACVVLKEREQKRANHAKQQKELLQSIPMEA